MSMVTVEGSEGIVFQDNTVINPAANSDDSQLQVIQKFMDSLDKSTKTNATEMLNEAIQACSTFTGISDAINHFLRDAANNSNFLTECCGIILGNEDTGAITGSDAGGATVKNAKDIVPETTSLIENTGSSFEVNGLTVKLSDKNPYSDLSDKQKYIWSALKTWWCSGAFDLISSSYGSGYGFSGSSTATVKEMDVEFGNDAKSGWLAYVQSGYSGVAARSLTLSINMYYYDAIDTTDPNGSTSSSGAGYLDRTLAHEFTHAVMSANINSFWALPGWLKEGMAELTHGIDDERPTVIRNLASNVSSLQSAMSLSSIVASGEISYAAGYMFLRYLAKNANSADNSIIYGTEYNDNDTKQGKPKTLYSSITNISNNKTIMALAGKDKITNYGSFVTIVGGTGNDNITLGGSDQVIAYNSGDGKDVVTNFAETDQISIAGAVVTTSSAKKNDIVLKVGKGSITLKNAKNKIITLTDDSGTSTRMYGSGKITVQGSGISETLTAWSKADSLNGDYGDDTLIGGKGSDTLTGGDGADVFYYKKGDGKDVITDYNATETDVIVLNDTTVTKVSKVKKTDGDLLFTVKKGSIRINNAVGQKITFKDADGNVLIKQSFGSDTISVVNSNAATINTSIDAAVLTVDASARTTDVMLIGNAKANYIKLGTGNETITTGKGKDTVEYLGGNATITDYTAGSDVIKFTHSEIVSAKLNSNNEVVFTLKDTGTTTATTTLTLQNMVKKKKVQKVTVIDKDGITYAQTFGSPTLTVGNSDGDTVIANSDVTVMNAAKRSKAVYLIGNEYDGTIKGGTKADTISAGLGNDYVTGGKGNDLFIFSGGKDTIGDYSVTSKNSDQITLSSVTFDTYYVDGKNVVMTFKNAAGTEALQESDTSLTIVNGKDKSITINGAARVYNDYYEKIFAKKDATSTYNAAGNDDSLHTVKLIDASKKTSSIYITGNNFSDGTISTVKGGTKADTLRGGIGNDILTGGKGADLFIYSGGNDTITDYTAGTDIISFSDTNLISAKYNGNDLEFTTNKGILTVQKAIKKRKDQKMTILDLSSKVSTAQIYGRTELTIGAKDGDTLDLSRSVNSDVTTVSASGRSKTAPITIIGNTKADNITGSKGDDTIILSTNTGRGKATITYTAGNDKITNWKADDALNLSNGQSLATATRVSDTNYKITVNKSKKAVGTLDISGDFSTEETASAAYTGTGTDSVNSYQDITSYVNIGGTKVAFNVQSKVKVSSAYIEREYEEDIVCAEDIFADTVISMSYNLSDLASANVDVKDNAIAVDYASSPEDISIVLPNEFAVSNIINKSLKYNSK